ncbi:hypothetical protein D8B31_19760 [Verminephrobacter eiseniae]|nr:hypothetical protein [Verminephrobacter eiseniae]
MTNASVKVGVLTVKAIGSICAAVVAVDQISPKMLTVIAEFCDGKTAHTGRQIIYIARNYIVVEKIQYMRVMGVVKILIELTQTQRPVI